MNDSSSQRGQSLVVLVLMLFVLLMAAALAVDVGVLYTARTSAQHIADACALAGAYTFIDANLLAKQPAAAKNAALAAAKDTSNKQATIMGQTVTVTVGDADVTLTPNQTVTATASVTVPVFFSKLIFPTVDITTTATAEAAKTAGGTTCLRPFWVTNSTWDPVAKKQSCANPLIKADGTVNPTVAAALKTSAGWVMPLYGDCAYGGDGNTANCSSEALVPSQWGMVDPSSYGGGGGAQGVYDALQTCVDKAVICSAGKTLSSANGAKINKIMSAVNTLIGSPPDTFVAPFQYKNSSGVISDTSKSVITIAVFDDCNGNPVTSGKQTFQAVGYGSMFLKGTVGSGNPHNQYVDAVMVSLGSCGGTGNGNGGSGGTGPNGIPIRLVHK